MRNIFFIATLWFGSGSQLLLSQGNISTLRCLFYPNKTLIKIDGVLQKPSKGNIIHTTAGIHQIHLWSEGHYIKDTSIFLNAFDTLTFMALMTKTPEYKEFLKAYNKADAKKNRQIVTPYLLMGGSIAFTVTSYFRTKSTYNELKTIKEDYDNETYIPMVHKKAKEQEELISKFESRRNIYRSSLGVLALSSAGSYILIRAARRTKLPIFQDNNSIHWQPIGLLVYPDRFGLQTSLTLNLK